MSDIVQDCLQDVVDRINLEVGSEFYGHALMVYEEVHVKNLQSITSAPAIAIMHGGVFGGGDQGARQGYMQLFTVEVFIVSDIQELCGDQASMLVANVDTLETIYKIRELVHKQNNLCKQWKLVSETAATIEGVSGFLQRWDTQVSLYQ